MPNYIVSIDDLREISTREQVPDLLKKMSAKKICEIGVRRGEYLSHLLMKDIEQVIAVDIWQETGILSQNDEIYSQPQLEEQYQCVVKMQELNPQLKIVRDFSVNASKMFPDEYFDFVYIDADHTESAVYADLNAWYSKVRKGGVLAGHDYSPAVCNVGGKILIFGVIQAVNKFINENKLKLYVDKNMSFFIIKE